MFAPEPISFCCSFEFDDVTSSKPIFWRILVFHPYVCYVNLVLLKFNENILKYLL